MNSLDRQYQDLLFEIITCGTVKDTRNGKTVSVFGRQIRHKMKDGFPLLTTKKMYWKGIVTELLWFLRGDTNIKYLVDNDVHIWDGDAYKNYRSKSKDIDLPENLYRNLIDDLNKNAMFPIDNPSRMLSQEEFIIKIKTDFDFAKQWGELGPVYGQQWRSWNKYNDYVDQIANLINDLRTNPDSRRLMVNAWNVGELDQMVLPPCHYGFQVYTRELSSQERKDLYDKTNYTKDIFPTDENGWNNLFDGFNIPTRAISLMWNQRSVDTFLGLPFNIASYGLLLEILAKMTNMVPDELIGNLGDVHLYQDHLSQAREQITRQPYRLPKLEMNGQYWVTDCGLDTHILSMLIEDFQVKDYESHSTIKAPLLN